MYEFLVSGKNRAATSKQAKKGNGNLHIQGCTALLQVNFFFILIVYSTTIVICVFILKLTIDAIIYADIGMRALRDWSEEC